jgi:hypothetical protein
MKRTRQVFSAVLISTLLAIPAIAGVKFHPSSIKDSQSKSKKASNRSGNAALEVVAVMGSDLVTEIQVTAGHADAAGLVDRTKPLGTIEKLQVKVGSKTTNYNNLNANGSYNFTLTGLATDQVIQIQANIKGVDPKRTDVVTVEATVDLLPDLAVIGVTAPREAKVDLPVVITASALELNGDLGAQADCVLMVDGVEVDRNSGIWVGAGSNVTCTFSHTFSTAGPHQLSVSAIHVVPGDFNLANNLAEGSIEILSPAAEFLSYSVYAYETQMTSLYDLSSPASSMKVTSDRYDNGATFIGYIGALDFPSAKASVKHFTGSTMAEEFVFDLASTSSNCFSKREDLHYSIDVCRESNGNTQVQTTRSSGVTSYVSEQWASDFNAASGAGYFYDDDTISHGSPGHFGSTYEIELIVEDAQSVYKVHPIVSLETVVDVTTAQPYQCTFYYGYGSVCLEYSYTTKLIEGSASESN